MDHRITSRALFFLFLFVCLLFPPAFSDDGNDTWETAEELLLTNGRCEQTGLSVESGDIDWYKIYISEPSSINVKLFFSPGNANDDLDMEIYQSNHSTKIAEGYSGSENENATGNYDPGAGAHFYIRVHGWGSCVNDYDMKIHVCANQNSVNVMVPENLGLEMPAGQTSISITEDPLKALLEQAAPDPDSGEVVTVEAADGSTTDFPIGPTEVIWRAWSGEAGTSDVVGLTRSFVYVFQHGQVPVDVTYDTHSTSGNHGANIVRTPDGTIHMAWLATYKGAGGNYCQIVYCRAEQDSSGEITVTNGPVYFGNDGGGKKDSWKSYVAVSATDTAVHFCWQGVSNHLYYRRLFKDGDSWTWDDIEDTGADGDSSDNGPDIDAFSDTAVFMITRDLEYAECQDVSASPPVWTVEDLAGSLESEIVDIKYPSIAVDPDNGDAHVVFTAKLHNNYYTLWYKRKNVSSGNWVESYNALGSAPWNDPGDAGTWRTVADWVEVVTDSSGTLHLGWHGTALTGGWGQDDTFYMRRTKPFLDNEDNPIGWESPFNLQAEDGDGKYSWCPSLCVDVNADRSIALPVIMMKTRGIGGHENYGDIDTVMRLTRDGVLMDGGRVNGDQVIMLSDVASWQWPATVWYPTTSPILHEDGQGRRWLDVLHNVRTQDGTGKYYVVYQRKKMDNADPTAAADSYSTDMNETLNVNGATGVLANDTDADSDELKASLTIKGTEQGNLTLNADGSFTYTPPADWTGTDTFTYQAYDWFSQSSETEIMITVGDSNTPPELNPIGNQTVDEGTELTFTASATDTDVPPDTLTYSLSNTSPSGAAIDPTSGVFTWTPVEAQGPGSYTFDVVVSDGTTTDSETITVTVDEANLDPVLGAIGNKTVDEGTELTFTASATDADVPADTLTFSLGNTPPTGASINATSGVFTWTPTEAQGPDEYTFDIVVSDGNDTDSETITVTVDEVNSVPDLGTIGNQTVDEETELTFTVTAADADEPANVLTFSLGDTSPAGASIDPDSGVFTWIPTEAQGPGTYTFDVKVSDGTTADKETITVSVNATGTPPVVKACNDQHVEISTPKRVALSCTVFHPDGSGILSYAWTVTEAPAGSDASITDPDTATPEAAFTPDASGLYKITVTVTDEDKKTAQDVMMIHAFTEAENIPPTADAGVDQASRTGDTVPLFGGNSKDPDSAQALTYAWVLYSKPAGSEASLAKTDIAAPVFTPDAAGTYIFTLQVTDSSGGHSLDITASNLGELRTAGDATVYVVVTSKTENNPPHADAGQPETVTVGESVSLDGSLSGDLDNDEITYQWTFLSRPAGSSAVLTDADKSSAGFTTDKTGEYVLRLCATDPSGLTDTDTITITANSPVSHVPQADAGTDQNHEAETGSDLTITLDGSGSADEDENITSYHWTQLEGPVVALDNSSQQTCSFVLSAARDKRAAVYTFELTVTDATGLTDTDCVSITVNTEDEHVPVIGSITNGSGSDVNGETRIVAGQDNYIYASVQAGGDTGETMVVYWTQISGPPAWIQFSSESETDSVENEVLIVRPVKTGMLVFDVYVDDGKPLSTSKTLKLPVVANTAPVANAGDDQTVTDTDNSGLETVTLDGSASSDADGEITGYVWKEDDTQIATGVQPEVHLTTGTHTITLTVTDNQGVTHSDTVVINVEQGSSGSGEDDPDDTDDTPGTNMPVIDEPQSSSGGGGGGGGGCFISTLR